MNKWLYRAVGAVGVASGALLLSNGVAHAQTTNDASPDLDPQDMRGMVADFFTPLGQAHAEFIGNLLDGGSPLGGLTGGNGLSGLTGSLTGTGTESPSSAITGSLTGNGDGLLDEPLGGPNSWADPSSLDGTEQRNPIDPAQLGGLPGDTGSIGIDGAASADVVSPSLRGTALDSTAQRPIQLNPDTARQVDDVAEPMVEALIADDVARRMGIAMDPATQPVEENLPLTGDLPGVSALMGSDSPLKDLLVVGNLANGVPGAVTKLPVVSQILDKSMLSPGNSGSLPIVGGIPFVGPALSSLGNQMMGTANGIAKQNPLGDPLKGSAGSTGNNDRITQRPAPTASQTGSYRPGAAPAASADWPSGATPSGETHWGATPSGATPSGETHWGATPSGAAPTTLPATVPSDSRASGASVPVPAPAGTQQTQLAAQSPMHVGRHRATDRPEVTDPELESASEPASLPLFSSLTSVAGSAMGGNVGTLPLSTLVRDMPLVNDVPLVGELSTQLKALKALPLVGTLAGLVPAESDTAA